MIFLTSPEAEYIVAQTYNCRRWELDELTDDFSTEAKTVNPSNATLDRLPAHVARPRCDRHGLTPGIVQSGWGISTAPITRSACTA